MCVCICCFNLKGVAASLYVSRAGEVYMKRNYWEAIITGLLGGSIGKGVQ